jgi:hypothetical protein
MRRDRHPPLELGVPAPYERERRVRDGLIVEFVTVRPGVWCRAATVAGALVLGFSVLGCGSPDSGTSAAAVVNRSFDSAPMPDAPAVLWAVGDGADGSRIAKALAGRIRLGRPDRVLYLGDVYDNGSAGDFQDHYATVYGKLSRMTAPTPGNHEWSARHYGYQQYWRARTGAAPPPWYTFRIGGWRVISLNSEAPHERGSPQLKWLRRTLRRGRGTCTLAFWHRPLQSAGLHGDQPDVAPLWNALRGRARLVLNGHDHDLQRLRSRDGITELVVGAGGRNLYSSNPADARLAFTDDRHQGALRIGLRPGAAGLSLIAANGKVLDRSRVACSPDEAPRAAIPRRRGLATAGRGSAALRSAPPLAGRERGRLTLRYPTR